MASESRPGDWQSMWRHGRPLLAPVLIWLFLGAALLGPVRNWLDSEEFHDRGAIQEWLEEARNADWTLAELVNAYLRQVQRLSELSRTSLENPDAAGQTLKVLETQQRVVVKREEIYQLLRGLGEPPTKMYPGQLPLFPVIYRLEVHFDQMPEVVRQFEGPDLDEPVVWDSGLEPSSGQYREAVFSLGETSRVLVRYQLRAWNKRQQAEAQRAWRLRLLVLLAALASVLGVWWWMLVWHEQSEQQRQRELAREQLDRAQRQRLEEERLRVEMERQLLEQRMLAESAERSALELKSQLYASIGIMAGSYAHNIKNLLVRPNDLLRRCLERPELPGEEERMLREVQQTLGLVTQRLEQILQTVRRDPTQSQRQDRLDLAALSRNLVSTWGQLAAERWQMDLLLEVPSEPVCIQGDESHMQQAVENLLFNARDATFERRSQLREAARREPGLDAASRKQAVIAAAAWRGQARLQVFQRSSQGKTWAILQVTDNGAGMTEEVRQRCTQTHFSTKRDNALYQGHSTGMGLGLSFVLAILENHRARLEIESQPGCGATFRAVFPASS